MPLSIIRTWDEATAYLDELTHTLQGDIRPLLHVSPGDPLNGAPFTICREVFCLVDHLGCLYTGLVDDVRGHFTSFLSEVMGGLYQRRAQEIYAMYRCGTQFQPKILINGQGQVLIWSFLNNQSADQDLRDLHLVPRVRGIGSIVSGDIVQQWELYVSTLVLLDDLEAAIKTLRAMLPTRQRITLWNQAVSGLALPRLHNFTV